MRTKQIVRPPLPADETKALAILQRIHEDEGPAAVWVYYTAQAPRTLKGADIICLLASCALYMGDRRQYEKLDTQLRVADGYSSADHGRRLDRDYANFLARSGRYSEAQVYLDELRLCRDRSVDERFADRLIGCVKLLLEGKYDEGFKELRELDDEARKPDVIHNRTYLQNIRWWSLIAACLIGDAWHVKVLSVDVFGGTDRMLGPDTSLRRHNIARALKALRFGRLQYVVGSILLDKYRLS